mgnify:CR=1 FL=1
MPTISVAMCTCNGAAYLREQLASIASQTRLPDEVVVSDDRSTDDTDEIVRRFAERARFPVHFCVNEERLGSTLNFGRAISVCSGDLIALSDQDDLWHPEKLQRVETAFDHDEIGAVFSDGELIDASGHSLGATLWAYFGFTPRAQRRMAAGEGLGVLLQKQVVTGAALVFRKRFVPLIQPIPNLSAHDRWIACLIAAVAIVRPIPEPLIQYRRHSSQQIGVSLTSFTTAATSGRLGEWANRQATVARRASAHVYADFAELYALVGSRLDSHPEFPCKAERRIRIDEKVAHLRARASLPSARMKRVGVVATEFGRGRYFTCSNGLYSLARDLFGR